MHETSPDWKLKGYVSWPRNCAAASSLIKNFARLGVYKIVLQEEVCLAGIVTLQKLHVCNRV